MKASMTSEMMTSYHVWRLPAPEAAEVPQAHVSVIPARDEHLLVTTYLGMQKQVHTYSFGPHLITRTQIQETS